MLVKLESIGSESVDLVTRKEMILSSFLRVTSSSWRVAKIAVETTDSPPGQEPLGSISSTSAPSSISSFPSFASASEEVAPLTSDSISEGNSFPTNSFAVPSTLTSNTSEPARRRNFATRNRRSTGVLPRPGEILDSATNSAASANQYLYQRREDLQEAPSSGVSAADASDSINSSDADGENISMDSSNASEIALIANSNRDVAQDHQSENNNAGENSQMTAQQGNTDADNPAQLEAITLGHLRSLINAAKPKARQYSYPTQADADILPREIDEFYSYVEAPQVGENRSAWEEWCALSMNVEMMSDAPPSQHAEAKSQAEKGVHAASKVDTGTLGLGIEEAPDLTSDKENSDALNIGEWTNLPTSARKRRIQALLSLLEVKDPTARQRASRALLYLLQGSFAETKGAEHQLSWIMENARMVRDAGGLGDIYSAFKIASWKHDWLSSLPDHIPSSEPVKEGEPPPEPLLTWQAKLEYLDEINLELALHFAQLYLLVETQRGEEEWADEMMSLDPPLPIYLFGLVAALRDKNAKGYPVKKLLLLLWKSLLASLGGLKDAKRCKEVARELEGLRPTEETKEGKEIKQIITKTSPLDLQAYQEEVVTKYPTYTAVKRQTGNLPLENIASAFSPIPPRKPFGSTEGMNGIANNSMLPATPAPSPPPSPKPNKQKYQTDQTRPFVFPYSRSVQGSRTVPFSIEEAGRLYRENMHVSLEMWQLWRLREECIQEESGIANAAMDGARAGLGSLDREMRRLDIANCHVESSSQGSRSPTTTEGPSSHSTSGQTAFQQPKAKGEPTLERLQMLEKEIDAELIRAESNHMLAVFDNNKFLSVLATLQQKREDVKRLQRVEMIYRAVLPHLQNTIIVLLKLLLATVTQQNISSNSPHFQALAEGIPIEDAPPPTLEDIDIVRHREITSKAISGIILLLLKWFKNSHVMKFNFLSQLLVDSNCLLLILKMFGLTELATQVRVVNEIPNFNFFKFCELNCGQDPRKPKPEDTILAKQPFEGLESPPAGLAHLNSTVDDDKIEHLDQYSFRNFFSGLNFTRILQKLTKKKVHRILLLVQYKSSAILKRTLKVPHPNLQLYALKIIKSQVPFCGRKWRQSNMKVITAIYLNCRPDLRDEWLSGADIDADVEESLPQEQALRTLIKYYNSTRIGSTSSAAANANGVGQGHHHKRSLSTGLSSSQLPDGLSGEGDASNGAGISASSLGPLLSPTNLNRANFNFFESDILPPIRKNAESTAGTLRYIPDDLLDGYLDNYEDILGEVFGEGNELSGEESPAVAWARLGEILGQSDSISDSESIGSFGRLDLHDHSSDDSGIDDDKISNEEGILEGAQTSWESLSPQAMKYLTSNPRPSTPGSPQVEKLFRRRSSEGRSPSSANLSPDVLISGVDRRKGSDSSPLRPVLSFGPELLNDDNEGHDGYLGNGVILQNDLAIEDEEEEEDQLPKPKVGGIDEVEHVWNM